MLDIKWIRSNPDLFKAAMIKRGLAAFDHPTNKAILERSGNPEEPEKILCSVEVIDKAVITSAGYERFFTDEYGKKYSHIFNPKTGYPAESDILSATIISRDGYYGDALSTAIYVIGSERAYKLWQKQKDFDFIIITDNKEIYISENLEKYFTVSEDSDYYFRTLP